MWGRPALCLGWRDLWTEGGWEGLGATQKSGISVLGGQGGGQAVSSLLSQSFLPLPECWSHFSDQFTGAKGDWLPRGQSGLCVSGCPAPGLPVASFQPEGLPPVMTRVLRTTSLVKSRNVFPRPLGINCVLGLCCYDALFEVPRNI